MAHLIWMHADGQQVLPLRDRHSIGRHPANDIQVLDKLVSKHHCVIERQRDSWVIKDEGSLNGTYVNGARVEGARRLVHLDQVTVGSSQFVLSDLEDAMRDAPEARSVSQVITGPKRGIDGEAMEPTSIVEGDPAPISVRIPRDVERQLVIADRFERAVAHAVAAPDRGAILVKALDDAVDLLDGRWGLAFFTPFALDAEPWSIAARGGPLPSERHIDPALVSDAMARKAPMARLRTETVQYRVWQPLCQIAIPVVHEDAVLAFLLVEREGSDDGLPLGKVELFAKLVGTLIARGAPEPRVLH